MSAALRCRALLAVVPPTNFKWRRLLLCGRSIYSCSVVEAGGYGDDAIKITIYINHSAAAWRGKERRTPWWHVAATDRGCHARTMECRSTNILEGHPIGVYIS